MGGRAVRTLFLPFPTRMSRLLGGVLTTVRSWAGWYLGAKVGLFTAFALSMVGIGAGIYFGRKLAERWGA